MQIYCKNNLENEYFQKYQHLHLDKNQEIKKDLEKEIVKAKVN